MGYNNSMPETGPFAKSPILDGGKKMSNSSLQRGF